eukprot:Rhum_TRINITY_DN14705_c10_g1::Rhum_TRINITY_DN14705_c10_g1_i1::g.112245::m.112245/K03648/UNG, UDG; uracil-DNA glycosylase
MGRFVWGKEEESDASSTTTTSSSSEPEPETETETEDTTESSESPATSSETTTTTSSEDEGEDEDEDAAEVESTACTSSSSSSTARSDPVPFQGQPTRECQLQQVLNVSNHMRAVRCALDAIRAPERLNGLGFETVELQNALEEVQGTMEDDIAEHEKVSVAEALVEQRKEMVDAFDAQTLRGLLVEKEKEEENKKEQMRTIVAETVADKVRFTDIEFQKRWSVEDVKRRTRELEKQYMQRQIEHLKDDIQSQRRLFLRISRAKAGDAALDEEERQREAEKAKKWAAVDAEYARQVAAVREHCAIVLKTATTTAANAAAKLRPRTDPDAGVPAAKRAKTDKKAKDKKKDKKDKTDKKEAPAASTASLASLSPSKTMDTEQLAKEMEARQKARTEATKQLFGLSENVNLFLWDQMKDAEWRKALLTEAQQPYFTHMNNWLVNERKTKVIFPPLENVFDCFNETPFSKVKVVILGQDPYHDNYKANGLCFSVKKGVRPPPSLKNIFKELKSDLGAKNWKEPNHGDLSAWAKRGVLLLNASLTVEANKAASHTQCGWQNFTDVVIKALNDRPDPIVFILWGNFAKKKCRMINAAKHRVIESAHPSPLSYYKFKGCKAFSRCNKELKKLGKAPIDWSL